MPRLGPGTAQQPGRAVPGPGHRALGLMDNYRFTWCTSREVDGARHGWSISNHRTLAWLTLSLPLLRTGYCRGQLPIFLSNTVAMFVEMSKQSMHGLATPVRAYGLLHSWSMNRGHVFFFFGRWTEGMSSQGLGKPFFFQSFLLINK